ncbi:MAG: hypothetical protein PHW13_03640 [Methylococcales bacterium]|nr:hypothetical protein [Methylococcales bacterium]
MADTLDLINASCPTGLVQFQELNKLRMDIATAETVEQARIMALAPTEQAIDALDNASIIMPIGDDLIAAKNRLNEARTRMLAAVSQKQVADEFSGIMLAGLDDNAANLKVGSTGCHYTTGEVIAIVIGLILGIIPGLVLLVLLC